jgi:hypothetical protein
MKGSSLRYVPSPSEVARQCRRVSLAGKSSALDLRTLVLTVIWLEFDMVGLSVGMAFWKFEVDMVDGVKRDQAGGRRLVQRTSKKGSGERGSEESKGNS